ncbi:MAG: DUF6733 family protein [Erythrobacter sp.]
MKIHIATAASALALAVAGAAPALASDQAVLAAATTLPLTAAEIPGTELAGEASGVVMIAAAETAPATIGTIGSAAGTNAALVTTAAAATSLPFDSAAVAAAVQASSAAATERAEKFTVVLNQDSFFGFYPTFACLIPVSEKVDLAFYGILWTTSDFSSATGLGSDLWTEFGIGANFHAADGKLMIKPQIGITNGALLSRGNLGNGPAGTTTTLNGGNVFDGIVPSLTMNYSDDKLEAEFYGGYYAALRNRSSNVGALDFLHTWINAGYKFTSNFSAGAHFEVLANTRVDLPRAGASNVYQWYGPYVQFTLKNGFFARFTGGFEEGGGAGGNRGDFYKLAAGFTF